MRLGCLFVLVPIVELALLVWVGDRIGLLPTLALVVSTGMLGAYLLRREGRRLLFAARQEIAAGKVPTQSAMSGIAIAVGGAFLLTPGVMTDVVGVALLLPPSRAWIIRGVRRRIERMIAEGRVQVMTWGVGGPMGRSGPMGQSGRMGRSGPVGQSGPTGGPGPMEPRSSPTGEDDDDRPPRPGEIIQE